MSMFFSCTNPDRFVNMADISYIEGLNIHMSNGDILKMDQETKTKLVHAIAQASGLVKVTDPPTK